MATLLKRELGIAPEMEHGSYGQFKILVDGNEVVEAGAMGFVAKPYRIQQVAQKVREVLDRGKQAPLA